MKARETPVNPATFFCTCMGGTWRLTRNEAGENGKCKIEGVEREYDEWEYFRKMNPMDNTLQKFGGVYEDWVNYCRKNTNSVYCMDNNGNRYVK